MVSCLGSWFTYITLFFQSIKSWIDLLSGQQSDSTYSSSTESYSLASLRESNTQMLSASDIITELH